MTILFTFFVLLFAYQKAMDVVDAKPAPIASASLKSQTSPSRSTAVAEMHPKVSSASKIPEPAADPKGKAITADAGNTPEGLVSAIAAMKSHSALHEVARDLTEKRHASDEAQAQDEPMPLKPALEAMARIGRSVLPDAAASEQTAQQLASLLANEAAKKRVDIIRAPHEIRLELNDAILFDPASAVLRAEGLALLDRLVPVLAQQTGILSIEGHTDPIPIANVQFPSNWELSSVRATAVTRHLIQKGIPAERLRAVGMADTRPRDSNATPVGRAKNRRVSLVVYLEEANPLPVPTR
jgi:chemotaxis protein MotB